VAGRVRGYGWLWIRDGIPRHRSTRGKPWRSYPYSTPSESRRQGCGRPRMDNPLRHRDDVRN